MANRDWFGLSRAATLGLFLACLAPAYSSFARADEALERDLLHQDAAFVLEVQKPLAWADHPLVRRVWSAVSESGQLKSAMETPEFQRILSAKASLQSASGQSWDEALSQLTADGVWLGVTPKPAERATLIITARDSKIWARLESQALKTLESLRQPAPEMQTYEGVKTYRIDKALVAFIDRRLIAASHEADLHRMIDGLRKQAGAEGSPPASSPPSVRLDVDLETVRQNPELQKTLKRPSDDAGQVATVGGWLDVLAGADRLTAKLDWPADSTGIQLKLTATGIQASEPLSGFFALSPNDSLAPLLEPPGTIYSATWFRDYDALWNQRGEVLSASAREKMEKGDNEIKQQFSVLGISYTPSELFRQFGTQHRFLMARAGEPEYRVELENRLPGAAICISLRDEEAFLKQAEPLSRAIGLLTAFGQAKMLTKTSDHAKARLTGFWFRDDEKAAEKGNRLRFNFSPTWAVAREHFILGSTRDVVAKVVDELDRQKTEAATALKAAAGAALITERQLLSFPQFAEALTDFREALLQGAALDRGLTFPDAIAEFSLAKDIFESLGRLTTQAAFTEKGFEYQLTINGSEQAKPKKANSPTEN